jgi:hypothetical protein
LNNKIVFFLRKEGSPKRKTQRKKKKERKEKKKKERKEKNKGGKELAPYSGVNSERRRVSGWFFFLI